MAQKKKLQVFVSSTYDDLRDERQAAVEAILTAGHIPAGMELFAAGDQSQLETIQSWINESDVFLLILGGRYGSVESKSEKSYVQLEYEYASDKGKALFAVVATEQCIDRKLKRLKRKAIEEKYPQKLEDFRKTVLSKMVRMWSDTKDIKLAILETLPKLSQRDELVGWIPGDQAVDTAALAEEIARLSKDNASLREQLFKALLRELGTTDSRTAIHWSWLVLAQALLRAANVETQLGEGLDPNSEEISAALRQLESSVQFPEKLVHSIKNLQQVAREVVYLSKRVYDPSPDEVTQYVLSAVALRKELGEQIN